MRKKLSLIIFLSISSICAFSQADTLLYLVLFSDKNNSPYSLQTPENFLSQKSIDRRAKQGISLDILDLPVDPAYLSQLDAIEGLSIKYSTKWLNGAVISFNNPSVLTEVESLPFTSLPLALKSRESNPKELLPSQELESRSQLPLSSVSNIYGESFNQIALHRGHLLHEAGYTGKGVNVAIIDAGFSNTDVLPVFDYLRDRNLIHSVYDFVDGDEDVYGGSSHGTFVLSTIGGYMPDSLIGTAPDANYWLFRSEDSDSENPIEECNWIAAAEMADSAGVDLISTSLGYSEFDNSALNYTPSQMDGITAIISKAAEIATSRGIVVLNSAGNKGNSEWSVITAPADARNIIAVGAVKSDSTYASFSSIGPSADGRVKPEIVAMGSQSTYANFSGGVSQGNGTSFACPIFAGLVASLIQAHPNSNSIAIREAVLESANHFYTPSNELGYGIPDVWKAHLLLSSTLSARSNQLQVLAYPNPFQDNLTIVVQNIDSSDFSIKIYDIQGREIPVPQEFLIEGQSLVRRINLSFLSDGFYLLEVESAGQRSVINLIHDSY